MNQDQQSAEREQFYRKEFWTKIVCAMSQEPPARFYASWLHGADYKKMVQRGIFVRDTPQMVAYCPRCKDETPVEPHRDQDGKIHYWRMCCFPLKKVNPKNFRVWFVESQPLFDLFREKVGIKGTITEVIPNQVWKWGRRGQQSFIYVRRVKEEHLKSVAAILKQFPELIFISPRRVYLKMLDIVLPNRGIAWDEVTSLDENYVIQFDMEQIEAVLTLEGQTRRSNAKSRLEKIDRLTTAMKEHYFLAKAHYQTTGGEILHRPTQAELAERAGTTPVVVTRCLRDEKAVILRTLWDNAENPNAIMNQ
jgi:hypothetical protein